MLAGKDEECEAKGLVIKVARWRCADCAGGLADGCRARRGAHEVGLDSAFAESQPRIGTELDLRRRGEREMLTPGVIKEVRRKFLDEAVLDRCKFAPIGI